MINAVLFDLDDTLLDREASLVFFIDRQYERFRPHFNGVPKETFVARFVELDHHGHTPKEQVYRQIAADFGLDGVWPQMLTDYFEEPWTCLHLPGLEPMLQTLQAQNRQLGIITNGPSPFQEKKIQAMGIASYFPVILVSAAEGISKPNPEIFWRAADRLGVQPAETVFVGDNPQADIRGAQSAGMKTVWKRVDHWGECLHPDAVCEDLAELPALIQQLET